MSLECREVGLEINFRVISLEMVCYIRRLNEITRSECRYRNPRVEVRRSLMVRSKEHEEHPEKETEKN